jgi:ATP synthase F1 delta subunit
VVQKLDLGDGKTQNIYERIVVTPPPEHAPPIKLPGQVGRITSNLYYYASSAGVLEAVEKDFKTIEEKLLGGEEWRTSRGATSEEKLELITKFTTENKCTDFTKEVLAYFVDQKLIKHLPEIKDQFFRLMKEKRGEIDVFVTSADALPAETLKQLEGLILKQIGTGGKSAKVNFKTDVDKDLVAGLRIRYKSVLIDNTIARKVPATKEEWTKAYNEMLA